MNVHILSFCFAFYYLEHNKVFLSLIVLLLFCARYNFVIPTWAGGKACVCMYVCACVCMCMCVCV